MLSFLGVLTSNLHHPVLNPGKAETPRVASQDSSAERGPKQAGPGAGMGLQQEDVLVLPGWLHSVQFSPVASDSLRPHESQHARPSCITET